MPKDLNKKFEAAFAKASSYHLTLPPDIMLKLYAFYKQATKGSNYKPSEGDVKLINAFKHNAWIQLSNLTEEEAKQGYIDLVEEYIKY
jgi:acyl-CoA-binding protein